MLPGLAIWDEWPAGSFDEPWKKIASRESAGFVQRLESLTDCEAVMVVEGDPLRIGLVPCDKQNRESLRESIECRWIWG